MDTEDLQNYDELNLKQLFFVLFRRKWVILFCIIFFGLIGAFIAFSRTPVYESKGSLLLYRPQPDTTFSSLGKVAYSLLDSYGLGTENMVDNDLQILRSRKLALKIADSLQKSPLMPNGRQYPVLSKNYPNDSSLVSQDTVALRLQESLAFKKAGNGTNVINITYKSISAIEAGRIIGIIADQFNQLSLQYGTNFFQERSQFGLGRIIDDGYIPQEPIKPNAPLYILLGLIFGGVLSLGYVFVDVAILSVIKSTARLNKMPAPLLGVLPSIRQYVDEHYNGMKTTEFNGENISTELITLWAPDSPVTEPFREVENNLFYADESTQLHSVAFTSTMAGEGKSTTVANLGVILTEAGHKVLCVDTDFRRPKLHQIFGLSNTPGITDMLSEDGAIEEAIQPTSVQDLYLLPAGSCPANIAATMKNQSFLDLLKKLESKYDFMLIDTAPFGQIADSALMLKQTNGVAVTAGFGKITDIQLRKTLEKLHRLHVNIRGTILAAYDYQKSNDIYPATGHYEQHGQPYKKYEEKV